MVVGEAKIAECLPRLLQQRLEDSLIRDYILLELLDGKRVEIGMREGMVTQILALA